MKELKTIDKKYRVLKRLGTGGFSDVFLVDGPEGLSAIKLLKTEILSNKENSLEKFKHEFELLKDMRHPHIARILDFGYDSENGLYYFTSEFIDGTDIFTATAEKSSEDTTDFIIQTLRALEYLHSYQVHHFDIKAANVLVMTDSKAASTVKIIDFGLADIDPRGRLIGTPSYMPPEIVERGKADARADLYSLGVLWYTILTRTNPFRAPTSEETLKRQLYLIPAAPSIIDPKIPAWLNPIILRMLEKNPSNRFQSADSIIREINRKGGKYYQIETNETLMSYLPDEGRFIGRTEEIKKIENVIAKIVPIGGLSQCWLIQGPRGIGKSRLLNELKYRLQLKEIHVQLTFAGNENEFSQCHDRLSSHITKGKGMEVFLIDDIDALGDNETNSNRLLNLLSHARRPSSNSSLFIALALSDESPPEFRSSIDSLANVTLKLKPFTDNELKEYLVSLTGLETIPTLFLSEAYRYTEGNPLFITEVIRSLIARGGLFDEYGRWKEGLFEDVGVDFSKVIIPKNLEDLLIERVSELPEQEKSMVEFLAVFGLPVGTELLGKCSHIEAPYTVALELIKKGVLGKTENFEVVFQNALMGEAILKHLPEMKRREMHDIIAKELRIGGINSIQILEQTSLGTNPDTAIHAAIELGDLELDLGRGKSAANYFNRALARIDRNDLEHLVEVNMKLGEAYLIGHDYKSAKDKLLSLENLLKEETGPKELQKWRIDILMRLGGTFIKLSEFDRARFAFERALSTIESFGGDKRRELTIKNLLASILMQEGKLNEAKEMFAQTRKSAEELPEEEKIKLTNNDLGAVLLLLKDKDTAAAVLGDDLKTAEKLGDDLLTARIIYNLAQLDVSNQDMQKAIERYNIAADICRRSNNIELLLRVYNGMGNTYHLIGNENESIKSYERGLELHERIGDLRGGATISINIGIAEGSRQNLEAALDRLVPAVEYLKGLSQKTTADWMALTRGLLETGDVLIRKGKIDSAKKNLGEALEITEKVPQTEAMRTWILEARSKADEMSK